MAFKKRREEAPFIALKKGNQKVKQVVFLVKSIKKRTEHWGKLRSAPLNVHSATLNVYSTPLNVRSKALNKEKMGATRFLEAVLLLSLRSAKSVFVA